MAKNTEESAAECSLHCKIEDNDEYFLEGKLAGQGLDLPTSVFCCCCHPGLCLQASFLGDALSETVPKEAA